MRFCRPVKSFRRSQEEEKQVTEEEDRPILQPRLSVLDYGSIRRHKKSYYADIGEKGRRGVGRGGWGG